MYLTRHQTARGARWALDNKLLPQGFTLATLLELNSKQIGALKHWQSDASADGELLAPIDDNQEVWASGVTYLRSREARMHESDVKDVYDKVYEAVRPELFFKAPGWRVVGTAGAIRVRADSHWNVPEPELTLVINRFAEIIGYTAGNDVSSRDIEGENPLYLPQAKIYDGSCALGPGIRLADAQEMRELPVQMEISRDGLVIYQDQTSIAQMKRPLQELADYLLKEIAFPSGVFLMTGAGIVPPDEFSLKAGDSVCIKVADLVLENRVAH